jgi:predicted Fe-S protein YdhL (DUF1289 family)
MNPSTESPCIGICSTVYGDNICRGCKRHYLEVIDWNRYDAPQKQAINGRLQQHIETVVAEFIVIEDEKKLKTQLDQVALRPPIYPNPLCWAYELLRLKSQQMTDLRDYGLRAKPPYDALTVNGLFTALDDKLYAFAQKK